MTEGYGDPKDFALVELNLCDRLRNSRLILFEILAGESWSHVIIVFAKISDHKIVFIEGNVLIKNL